MQIKVSIWAVCAIMLALIIWTLWPYLSDNSSPEKGDTVPKGSYCYGIDISHYQENIQWDSLMVLCDGAGRTVRSKIMAKDIKPVSFVFIKATEGNSLDIDWIDQIELAVPYIDNIFENPKRFIVSEEEILNIEKSKKVGVATVKHLSKHTNFISEVDSETGDIKPEKLLNELKEETFNTYENRFIYTLVDLLESFIHHMETKIAEMNYSKMNTFDSNSNTEVSGEEIKCSIKLTAAKKIDSLDKDDDFNFRIAVIKSNIRAWQQTAVYTSLKKEKAPKVKNPLNRTNVLLKNPNFKIAASLWDFIHSFRQKEIDNGTEPDVSNSLAPNLQSIVDNSVLMYYLITKISSTTNKYQLETYNRMTREAAMNMMKETTELLMDMDGSLTQQDLVDTVSNAYNEVKYKKTLDTSLVEDKIKNSIRKYIEKVDGSYFELESGVNNEKKINIKDDN